MLNLIEYKRAKDRVQAYKPGSIDDMLEFINKYIAEQANNKVNASLAIVYAMFRELVSRRTAVNINFFETLLKLEPSIIKISADIAGNTLMQLATKWLRLDVIELLISCGKIFEISKLPKTEKQLFEYLCFVKIKYALRDAQKQEDFCMQLLDLIYKPELTNTSLNVDFKHKQIYTARAKEVSCAEPARNLIFSYLMPNYNPPLFTNLNIRLKFRHTELAQILNNRFSTRDLAMAFGVREEKLSDGLNIPFAYAVQPELLEKSILDRLNMAYRPALI